MLQEVEGGSSLGVPIVVGGSAQYVIAELICLRILHAGGDLPAEDLLRAVVLEIVKPTGRYTIYPVSAHLTSQDVQALHCKAENVKWARARGYTWSVDHSLDGVDVDLTNFCESWNLAGHCVHSNATLAPPEARRAALSKLFAPAPAA